jgi:acetyl esterase
MLSNVRSKHIQFIYLKFPIGKDEDCKPELKGDSDMKKIEYTYKEIRGNQLKLHVFRAHLGESHALTPIIVFFHGGGWRKGRPDQFFSHAKHLASRGMTAISVEYRLIEKHGSTPLESMEDAQDAIRWLCKHAAELGVDKQQIVVSGGSAGGHLALSTVLPMWSKAGDTLSENSVKAIILFNPGTDTTEAGFGHELFNGKHLECSPFHHISAGLPSLLILHGEMDQLIPLTAISEFVRKWTVYGNVGELQIYSGQGHGFFNYKAEGNVYYDQTLMAMDNFLTNLGFLPALKNEYTCSGL